MAAHDPNCGGSRSKIQRDRIEDMNNHLENVDRNMNITEQLIRKYSEYFTTQPAEYQSQQLAMALIDSNTLFSMWLCLREMQRIIKAESSRLEITDGSLQNAISYLAIIERTEKSKELAYKQNIEKKKIQIETKLKSKCKSDLKQEVMDRHVQRLVLDMEQIRLEAQSIHTLAHEVKIKAERQKRRVEASQKAFDILLRQTQTLIRSIEREQELRCRRSEIAGEAIRLRQGQAAVETAAIVVILAIIAAATIVTAIAAAVGTRPLRQEESKETEEVDESAEEEKLKTETEKKENKSQDEKDT